MNKELKILGLRTFGHNKAIDFINKSIIMSKTSHAYLITGPENIGKKTLAVDLASILNAKPNKDMFDNQYVIDISSSKERSRIAGKKKVNAIKDGTLILISMFKLFFEN